MEKPSFVNTKLDSGRLSCSEEWENSKDSIWQASEKGNLRNQDSIWQASEEQKTKKPRFVNTNLGSGRLPKNGKLRNQDLIWQASEKWKTKKPKFDRVEWASDLWEKRNQDS
ncbi:unnamed protein product [Rhizophagus irregularis]|nr:unnamed protein product [Rhizophagus irregularis]